MHQQTLERFSLTGTAGICVCEVVVFITQTYPCRQFNIFSGCAITQRIMTSIIFNQLPWLLHFFNLLHTRVLLSSMYFVLRFFFIALKEGDAVIIVLRCDGFDIGNMNIRSACSSFIISSFTCRLKQVNKRTFSYLFFTLSVKWANQHLYSVN